MAANSLGQGEIEPSKSLVGNLQRHLAEGTDPAGLFLLVHIQVPSDTSWMIRGDTGRKGEKKYMGKKPEQEETEFDESFIPLPEIGDESVLAAEEAGAPAEPEKKTEDGLKETSPVETPSGMEPFRFKDEIPSVSASPVAEKKPDEKTEDTFQLIHNGQVHHLTKERFTALAQKGFDYDYKIGPHGKIVQMIESDPGVANAVNQIWQAKVAGKPFVIQTEKETSTEEKPVSPAKLEVPKFTLKPLSDFDDEGQWMAHHVKPYQEALTSAIEVINKMQSAPPAAAPPASPVSAVATLQQTLTLHDPDYSGIIIPHLNRIAEQNLTKAQYDRVSTGRDMGATLQFYDWAKPRLLAELGLSGAPAPANTEPQPKSPTPSFKVRSGGGVELPAESDPDLAWKKPRDQFQKDLQAIRGY